MNYSRLVLRSFIKEIEFWIFENQSLTKRSVYFCINNLLLIIVAVNLKSSLLLDPHPQCFQITKTQFPNIEIEGKGTEALRGLNTLEHYCHLIRPRLNV